MRVITVEKTEPTRLDVYLTAETDLTRSNIKQLLDGGHILLDGKSVKSGKIVSGGEQITIEIPEKEIDLIPENIPLDIIFEDEHIAVINKQRGLTVHPGGGAASGTLANALLFHFCCLSKTGGNVRPGIVHRLDKDTTGVMVVAKTDAAHLDLSRQIANRTVKKLYHALLEGVVAQNEGEICQPIGRSPSDRKKMAVTKDGRSATTGYRVIERFLSNTLVEFDLKTGRTHQIRVHAKHMGQAVVGDASYGHKKQRFNLEGQLLHSKSLEFVHPSSGQKMEFSAPYPQDFVRVLTVLKNETNAAKKKTKD